MEIIRRALRPSVDLPAASAVTDYPDQNTLRFAMQHNGYRLNVSGEWTFDPMLTKLVDDFKGTRVSFFGPGFQDKYFSADSTGHQTLHSAFNQTDVTDSLNRLCAISEDKAKRVSFILGGLVRHLTQNPISSLQDITDSVKFVSRLTLLGNLKSAEAIAAAGSMYVISGGKRTQDDSFKHLQANVYYMAEAIDTDPITPSETMDLGLSQMVRLRSFIARGKPRPLPDIFLSWDRFKGFPTIGAEFHLPKDVPKKFPNFWQRLAILNMSQYHPGSFIQLSRNDRDVIEVRMNPSVYPAAIANWNHIRLLLPELNQAYFTVTINRNSQDFFWKSRGDLPLLETLRSVGMLCYAGSYQEVPLKGEAAEMPFGSVYLGQTVRLSGPDFLFTGLWSKNQGEKGQLGIYAGFGDNFPDLAYNLSWVLAEPTVLGNHARKVLSKVKTLEDALALNPSDRKGIFNSIQNLAEANPHLRKISNSGKQIMQLLNP